MALDDALTLAFNRFAALIGKWELRGRTLSSEEDDITGWNTFEWILDGMFLKSEGEITFQGSTFQSIELIAYDPQTQRFPSHVYSSMSGEVIDYEWDIQGSTVIHSGSGATYRGILSADGNSLTGGWRPDEGTSATDGPAYAAVMVRVQ